MLARILAAAAVAVALPRPQRPSAEMSVAHHRDDHPVRGGRRRRPDRPRDRDRRSARNSGRTSIVLNRDGAAGTLGFGPLAAAAPDGHMIGFGPSTPIANAPYLVKGVRYNVEFVRLHLPGVRERVHDRGRPTLEVQVGEGAVRCGQGQGRQLNFGHAGPRHHSSSVGREPRRRVEGQGPARAVPRRRADGAGAAQRRDRFRRVGISSIRGNDKIRPLVVFADEAPSGLSRCADRERTGRRRRRCRRDTTASTRRRDCRPR